MAIVKTVGVAVETERAWPVSFSFTRTNLGAEMAVAVSGNPFRLRTYDRRKPHARL